MKTPTGSDLQEWFLGLPMIVILLILALVAVIWFGYRFLQKERLYYQRLIESDREYFRSLIEKKDAQLERMTERNMLLYQTAIETETTLIREIRDMQDVLRDKLK